MIESLAMLIPLVLVAVVVTALVLGGMDALLPSLIAAVVVVMVMLSFLGPTNEAAVALSEPLVVKVAASDSSAADKSRAAYVVTGSAEDELAAAIAYAAANGKTTVRCYAGTYELAGNVAIAANLTFEGVGASSVFQPALELGATSLIGVWTENVTVRQFRVHGVTRWAHYGLHIGTGAINVLAEDIWGTGLWDDDTADVVIDAHNVTLRRFNLTGNTQQPGELNSLLEIDSGPRDVVLEDSVFWGTYYNALAIHTHTGKPQTHDIIVRRNTFTGAVGDGVASMIRLAGDQMTVPETLPSYNLAVSHNTLTGSVGIGMFEISGVEDVTISGNTVTASTTTPVLCFQVNSTPTRVTFTGNSWAAPAGQDAQYVSTASTVFDDIAFGPTEVRMNVTTDAWIDAGILAGEITGLP